MTAALQIPTDKDGTVFLSYNFEANFNMPTLATDLTIGPLKNIQGLAPDHLLNTNGAESSLGADTFQGQVAAGNNFIASRSIKDDKNASNINESKATRNVPLNTSKSGLNSLISRKKFYKTLDDKLVR